MVSQSLQLQEERGALDPTPTITDRKGFDPMIDEGLNGALCRQKAKEEMPSIPQPLISNEFWTKRPPNIVVAMVLMHTSPLKRLCRCMCFGPCTNVRAALVLQSVHIHVRVYALMCM